MNLGWKDYYIIITLYIIGILAMFTIIDLTIEKQGTVGVGAALSFIGAILGGTISGVITLLGVKLTIREQRRMVLEEKIDKADFIYKKMSDEISKLNFCIEDFYTPKDAYKTVTNLIKIIDEHYEMLKETEIEFVRRIDVIKKELENIKKDFDDLDGPNGLFVNDLLEGILIRNEFIQYNFISLKKNYFSKYK